MRHVRTATSPRRQRIEYSTPIKPGNTSGLAAYDGVNGANGATPLLNLKLAPDQSPDVDAVISAGVFYIVSGGVLSAYGL